jgi:cobaltochelatase CobT
MQGMAALETTLEKVARIIARRRGVRVVLRGGQAYADLKKMEVVLPAVGEEQYKHMAPYLDGICDHECGHVLWTTQATCEEAGLGGVMLHGLWNVLEDFRTEQMTASEYFGCGQNLTRMNQYFLGWWDKEAYPKADAFGKLAFGLGCLLRGDKSVVLGDAQVSQLLVSLAPEVSEARAGMANDAVALELAKRILEKLKDLAEPKPEDKQEQDDQEEGEGGGEGSDQGDEQRPGKKSKPGKDTEEPGDSDETQRQAREMQAGADDYKTPETVESMLDGKVNPVDRGNQPDEYLVFSTQYDVETHYDLGKRTFHALEYAKLKKEIQGYVGTMAAALEAALSAESEARWIGGERRGKKLDRRRLADWAMGSENDHIWKRLEQGEVQDTVVCLLWDCSGSMGSSRHKSNKAALARLAAIAFHEALLKCGIAHEVLGFNTDHPNSHELGQMAVEAARRGESLDRYSRVDELDSRMVFVDYGQADGRAICEITGAGANRDGEAVLWAAKRLATRKEKRKILIVGSDGQPAGARHTRTGRKFLTESVKRVKAAGIEVVAIGIMDNSVEKYYSESTVIQDATDLPKVVLGELTNLLLGKGTRNATGQQRRAVSGSR